MPKNIYLPNYASLGNQISIIKIMLTDLLLKTIGTTVKILAKIILMLNSNSNAFCVLLSQALQS